MVPKKGPGIPDDADLFDVGGSSDLGGHVQQRLLPHFKRTADGTIRLRKGYRFAVDGVPVYEEPGEAKQSPNDMLTIPEVRELLNQGLTKVKQLIRDGDLPSAKLGRSRRVRRAAVDQYLEDHEAGRYKKGRR
jgi:excisionase family DNA binding protein